MAVTRLEQLIPWFTTRLPGCPDEMMLQELRNAWREFCARSEWWRPPVDINLAADQTRYNFNPPADATCKRLVAVFYRDETARTNQEDGRALVDGSDFRFEQDATTGQWVVTTLWTPNEAESEALRVKCVLVPNLGTSQPPPVTALEMFGDGLCEFAVMTLASQTRKKWSSMATAALARQGWDRAIAKARRMNAGGWGAVNPLVA